MAYLERPLQVRTTAAMRKKLDGLNRRTGLNDSQLLRYALHRLPDADQMDANEIVDLIEDVTGREIHDLERGA